MRVDEIEIHAGRPDFNYKEVRWLEAQCEAKTNFSKTPTMEDVNSKLRQLALKVGANAVVETTYNSGISITSWRSVKARGLAVLKEPDDIKCRNCAETIKREAVKCRFCGEPVLREEVQDVDVSAKAEFIDSSGKEYIPIQDPLKSSDNTSGLIIAAIFAVLVVAGFILYAASSLS